MEAWKYNFPAFLGNYNIPTDRQKDLPTNQPTDGHNGSYGSCVDE